MNTDIVIIEKPDWVSWDDIHEVIWKAHGENRKNGILLATPYLSGEDLKQKIEGRGLLLVALIQKKVVATAAIIKVNESLWCWNGDFAYMGFASVLPEYKGTGIYKALCLRREKEAKKRGLCHLLFNTHSKNSEVIAYGKKHGYRCVDVIQYDDHYNVKMIKRLNDCPYPDWYCEFQFKIHFLYRTIKYRLVKVYHYICRWNKTQI